VFIECGTEYNDPPFSSYYDRGKYWYNIGNSDVSCFKLKVGDECDKEDDKGNKTIGQCAML